MEVNLLLVNNSNFTINQVEELIPPLSKFKDFLQFVTVWILLEHKLDVYMANFWHIVKISTPLTLFIECTREINISDFVHIYSICNK